MKNDIEFELMLRDWGFHRRKEDGFVLSPEKQQEAIHERALCVRMKNMGTLATKAKRKRWRTLNLQLRELGR